MVANPLARRLTARCLSDVSDSSVECYMDNINNMALRSKSKRKTTTSRSDNAKAKTARRYDSSLEYKISAKTLVSSLSFVMTKKNYFFLLYTLITNISFVIFYFPQMNL